MKRAMLALAVAVPLAGAHPAAAIEPFPDVVDCGPDTRDWFDGQVDVDFPTPPPEELDGVLLAIGCPQDGEPTYRGPFDPEVGEPDPPAEPQEEQRAEKPRASKKKTKKKCARSKGAKRKRSCRRS